MDPRVGIVISGYNQTDLLVKCIESLKKNTDYKNYKIFFIDDSGSEKISPVIRKEFGSFVDVNINKKNLGFSKTYNAITKIAIKKYNPDYILLLNDDCEIIEKDWLNKLIDVGEIDSEIGILGCKLVYEDKTLQNIGGYIKKWEITKELRGNLKKTFEVDHVMGAFMLIKVEVIKKIGLLDEAYTPYLLEDTDYCLVAKRAGFKIVSVPSVMVIHKKGRTLTTLDNSTKMFVRFKNEIYFSFKNLGFFNRIFRVFIYSPMVAIFKKKTDEDSLSFSNFIFRPHVFRNLGLYFKALWRVFRHDTERGL